MATLTTKYNAESAKLSADVMAAARAEAKRTSRTISATLDLALRRQFKLPKPDAEAA